MTQVHVGRSSAVRRLTAGLLLLLSLRGWADAENVTMTTAKSATESTKPEDEEPVTSSENTLLPIYKMAKLFVELVAPPGGLAELNGTQNLSTFQAALHSAESDWQTWLKHYWSYLVCLVLAVAYIVVFPVVGCVLCGCRGAGRCLGGDGRARAKRSAKSWHWYRRICSFLLLLLAVGLLFGVISMFLATNAVYERTRPDDGNGVPQALARGLENFGIYLDRAKDWYVTGGPERLRIGLDDIKTKLDRFGTDVRNDVGRTTGIASFFSTAADLVRQLDDALATTNSSDDVASKSTIAELAGKLAEFRNNVTERIGSCNSTQCQSVRNLSSSLRTVANLTSLPSFADVRGSLKSTTLAEDLNSSLANYDEILHAIRNKSNATRRALVAEHDDIMTNFSSFLNATLANTADLSLGHVASYVSENISPNIDRFGEYFYYGGLTLSTVMLLVDALYFLGLLYGACGSLDDDKTECCKKAKAEPILKLALGCMFASSWIIMLAVGVLFPIGGIVHNDLCRNLLLPPPDPESARVVDAMFSNSMNLSWSLLSLYEHCDRNEAIYEAFHLGQEENGRVNLTRVLSVDSYELAAGVGRLSSADYLNSPLDVIGTSLTADLDELNKSTTTLDVYREQLGMPLLSQDLSELRNAVMSLNYTESLASAVATLQNEEYARAVNARALLNASISELESFQERLHSAMVSLDGAQRDITAENTSRAAAHVADAILDRYRSTFGEVGDLVKTELARCGSVARDISRTRDSLCVKLLQPYNAFWFSAAWCLVLFVVLVPNVIVLINWFWPGRRPIDYRSSYLDDPNQIDGRQPAMPYDNRADLPRGKARIPYEHLPAISGARASPVTGARNHYPYQQQQQQQQPARQYPAHHEQVAGDWDWQPDDDFRDQKYRNHDSPRSHERQWTNLAYDDGYDRRPADVDDDDLRWRKQAREQYRGRYAAGYRDATRPNKYSDYRGNDRARRYDDNPVW